MPCSIRLVALLCAVLLSACSDSDDSEANVYAVANQCHSVFDRDAALALQQAATSTSYVFAPVTSEQSTRFFFKPSGLGTYLLYDEQRGYLVSDGNGLQRATRLDSDVSLVDDDYESEAEWVLQTSEQDPAHYRLQHRKSGGYLAASGIVADAAAAALVELQPQTGCAEFPEEQTFATGQVKPPKFEDGSVFGFIDAHSHILANFAFGGGGIFHGAPFHRLGVEHALGSCERFHASEGRGDLFGYGFDNGSNIDLNFFIQAISTGRLPNFNHHTEGYPEFTTWPSGPFSSTHQVQYYKWLERAYLGGLRLVVQHAVNNQIICDFLAGGGIQPVRYSCNEMVGIDRQIDEVYNMQDYIDAQEGGPGEGWFRVVRSPSEARDVIRAGKMAVILGIETSNVFDCFLTPQDGFPACTEEYIQAKLDDYYDRGIRAIFPVHKYDNAFSAGDGNKTFIELGNVLMTGHFSNFSTDCDPDVPTVFDAGAMGFPGLNRPRDNYVEPAPNDFTEFYVDPLRTLGPVINALLVPPIPGESNHCQRAGLTDKGEFFVEQMMRRGMILEIDHLPRKSYKRVFELMVANDYPAAGTHGLDNFGKLYALGGVSTAGFGRCRSADQRATVDDGFQSRLSKIVENGGFPGLGFGLDLNGFAGAHGPRFGARAGCATPQTDPLTYPFTSYAGDITFEQPKVGNRTLDFNTEGLAHIGLLPDLIEDVRRDGVTDAELEPLFKSAEGYIRMWEKAESRAAALRRN